MPSASTAGENGKAWRTTYIQHGLLTEPISYFRTLQLAASNLLHHEKAYFGADMVKARTISVKRY